MMPEQKELSPIVGGRIQYIVLSSVRHTEELGEYVSCDIAAVDNERREIVACIGDVTCDRALAAAMADRFNQYQLSPAHLKDAILDMLP